MSQFTRKELSGLELFGRILLFAGVLAWPLIASAQKHQWGLPEYLATAKGVAAVTAFTGVVMRVLLWIRRATLKPPLTEAKAGLYWFWLVLDILMIFVALCIYRIEVVKPAREYARILQQQRLQQQHQQQKQQRQIK